MTVSTHTFTLTHFDYVWMDFLDTNSDFFADARAVDSKGRYQDALDGLEGVHDRVDARVVPRERRPPAAFRVDRRSICTRSFRRTVDLYSRFVFSKSGF